MPALLAVHWTEPPAAKNPRASMFSIAAGPRTLLTLDMRSAAFAVAVAGSSARMVRYFCGGMGPMDSGSGGSTAANSSARLIAFSRAASVVSLSETRPVRPSLVTLAQTLTDWVTPEARGSRVVERAWEPRPNESPTEASSAAVKFSARCVMRRHSFSVGSIDHSQCRTRRWRNQVGEWQLPIGRPGWRSRSSATWPPSW